MAYPTNKPSTRPASDGITAEQAESAAPTATGASFNRVAATLKAWDEGAMPGIRTRDALAAHLTQMFPTADVTMAAGAETADVVVDDIGVVLVRTVNRADTLDATFGILAEQYDALVMYSDSLHSDRPDTWRLLERRYTAGRLDVDDVAFVAGEKVVSEQSGMRRDDSTARDALLLGLGAAAASGALAALLTFLAQAGELGTAFYGAVATLFLVTTLFVLFLTNA